MLISVLILTFSLISFVCAPFFINFDEKRKVKIERLFSDAIKYQVSIKGTIKYKLKPLPTLELSEVHVSKKDENSILNKVFLNEGVIILKGFLDFKKNSLGWGLKLNTADCKLSEFEIRVNCRFKFWTISICWLYFLSTLADLIC